MGTLIRLAVLSFQLSNYHGCEVVDWGLDNVRDDGADSVGMVCEDNEDCPLEAFLLIGPDFGLDRIK